MWSEPFNVSRRSPRLSIANTALRLVYEPCDTRFAETYTMEHDICRWHCTGNWIKGRTTKTNTNLEKLTCWKCTQTKRRKNWIPWMRKINAIWMNLAASDSSDVRPNNTDEPEIENIQIGIETGCPVWKPK